MFAWAACRPPRMRSNAVGGGDSYFMLGVGGCNYDASTHPFPSQEHSYILTNIFMTSPPFVYIRLACMNHECIHSVCTR